MFKSLTLVLTATLLLAGCGSTSSEPSASPTSPSASPSPSFSPEFPRSNRVPASCESTEFINIITEDFNIENVEIINVPYQPNPDTPLYRVLNEGGAICDFGNQETRQGLSIGWLEDDGTIFDEFSSFWKDMGYKNADIPGIEETRGQFLYRKPSAEGQSGIWSVNFVVDGIWIQIFTTITEDLDDGAPLIEAAVASIRN